MAAGMYEKSILSSTDFEKMIERNLEDWRDSKKFDFKIKGGAQTGNPSAAFEIVEFSDFQCPHCKRAAPSLHAFVSAHRDDVHFVFQNYPLDKSCNPRGGAHELACQMARASLCALKQNKFEEAEDWIFGHQDDLDNSSCDKMIAELALDKGQMDSCMKDQGTFDQLKAEIDRGNDANIEGTPSIFVNGKLLPGGFLIPVLEAALKSSK
jgi:protein-disulfide isomerase